MVQIYSITAYVLPLATALPYCKKCHSKFVNICFKLIHFESSREHAWHICHWTQRSKQECTRWNVSPSILIIDIMLIVLSIKLYYNCHINLTLTKITKQRPMNHENEVKVRWTMPGRHVQLTMLLYNIYSWPITYSLRKIDQNTKT